MILVSSRYHWVHLVSKGVLFCILTLNVLFNGSATSALAIYLRKLFFLDIITSDYDDQEIEENMCLLITAGLTGLLLSFLT